MSSWDEYLWGQLNQRRGSSAFPQTIYVSPAFIDTIRRDPSFGNPSMGEISYMFGVPITVIPGLPVDQIIMGERPMALPSLAEHVRSAARFHQERETYPQQWMTERELREVHQLPRPDPQHIQDILRAQMERMSEEAGVRSHSFYNEPSDSEATSGDSQTVRFSEMNEEAEEEMAEWDKILHGDNK